VRRLLQLVGQVLVLLLLAALVLLAVELLVAVRGYREGGSAPPAWRR
jgi:hypothetical protein